MLAIRGLFLLIRDYHLDYPRFFERLYALLTPDVMCSKHRCVCARCAGRPRRALSRAGRAQGPIL